jgi:lysophospholipase L1-like esterase
LACLALLVALALCVVVLEWVLRNNVSHFLGAPVAARLMYEMDEGHSYRLKPGWTGEQTVDGRTTGIHINDRGMRGAEVGRKQTGEVRVLMLGDSMVFGHGVADSETIPARLEGQLRDVLGVPVTVGNGGVAGYGTCDFLHSFKRHLSFEPDLVIACTYLGNDFMDDCRRYGAVIDGYLMLGPMARVAHRSLRFRLALRYRTAYVVERFLSEYVPTLAFDRGELEMTPEEREALLLFPLTERKQFAGLFMDRRADDQLVAKVLARCRQSYQRLAKLARPIPILLVVIPTWWHLSPDEWRSAVERAGYLVGDHEIGAAQRRLLRVAEDLELPAIDLTPLLRDAADRDSLWLPTDRHLSPEGCRRVAEWLVPEVRGLLRR